MPATRKLCVESQMTVTWLTSESGGLGKKLFSKTTTFNGLWEIKTRIGRENQIWEVFGTCSLTKSPCLAISQENSHKHYPLAIATCIGAKDVVFIMIRDSDMLVVEVTDERRNVTQGKFKILVSQFGPPELQGIFLERKIRFIKSIRFTSFTPYP